MYLLFDLGATKWRLALSRDGQSFDTPVVIATPKSEELVMVFQQTAWKLLDKERPGAVAGGLSRHFYPLKNDLTKLFSSPVYLENDAALAGLGEAVAGAGQGFKIVSYVTVSTGVGGVRITDNQIDQAFEGFEPGKQIIDYHDTVKNLEDQISGRALAERFGKSPTQITDLAVWEELARLLAVGLHNTMLHWSPEAVVRGGSMMTGRPRIELTAVQSYLEKISTVFPQLPVLKLATLGDFGGLHGALHFLRQKLSR